MNEQKTRLPEPSADCSWVVTVSDKGVIIRLSHEAIESCRKTVRAYLMHVLPWLLAGLTTAGGTAGVRVLLQQQQGTPATSPTEDVSPQP